MGLCCFPTISTALFTVSRTVRAALPASKVFAAALVAAACLPARAEPPERLAPCLACHGAGGTSELENVPSLGGQRPTYALTQLFMFREQLRVAIPMNDMAKPLSDDDLRSVSDFIATTPPPIAPEGEIDAARMDRGRALASANKCQFCHKPDLSGQEAAPRIGHQREDYLLKTLREYKSGARHGYEATMAEALQPLDDASLVELAYFVSHYR